MRGFEPRPLGTGRVLALLGAIAALLLPHATRIPLWISTATGVAFAVRALFAWRGYGMPPQWILAALALASAGGIWFSYGALFGRDAAVALLILMLSLKLMELRSTRDAFVLIVLGYFLAITDFLYSQTIATALYLVTCVWCITACLVAFQYRSQQPRAVPALRASAVMLAQAAPLMLVLFVLFPRIQGPLWGLPQATSSGVTGLSDSMSPGSLSNLSLSDGVAFRVDFAAPVPALGRLYWRGPVMWDFDGRTWRAGESPGAGISGIDTIGEPIRYTVTLEAHEMRWLFALDVPAQIVEGSRLTGDLQLIAGRPVRNRLRYDMSSHLDYRFGLAEDAVNLQRARRLPRGFNPRSVALADQWRSAGAAPRAIVQQALSMFRQQPFFYTLVPPELGHDSVDEFLFDTRRGFCEHFASSFVVLMRAAGLPARVVTGYQGGVLNPLGDYLMVRQSEAHAWAEVWIENEGWIRVDPTAAVSPQRIEAGIAAAIPDGEPLSLLVRTGNPWLRQMRFGIDAMANGWNQWVLGYSPDRQMRLFQRVGFSDANWHNLVIALMVVTGVVLGALSLVVMRRLRRSATDPLVGAWNALSRKLATASPKLARQAHEGPEAYLMRAAAAFPQTREALQRICRLYADARYGPAPRPTSAKDLARLVRALHLEAGGH